MGWAHTDARIDFNHQVGTFEVMEKRSRCKIFTTKEVYGLGVALYNVSMFN